MAIRRSFVKSGAMLLCLLILAFSSPRAVDGQKEQIAKKPGGTVDGYVIIEGDILVSPAVYQELVTAANSPQIAPIKQPTKFWPNGVVPYEFDDNVFTGNQRAMREAMKEIEAESNVRFIHCDNNNCSGNYLHIQFSNKNSSAVGMQGGEQKVNIENWGAEFTMVHELMHALGFWHTFNRADRDTYIRPICENFKDGGCNSENYRDHFRIESSVKAYGDYDFDSVMHYKQCDFSANDNCPAVSAEYPDGGITIQVREPYNIEWQTKIGQRNHLSNQDILGLSFLYPNADWRFLDISYSGGSGSPNGTFLRPYTSFAQAVANIPEGGTIWLLHSQDIPAVGTYNKRVKVRVAPGVVATLGS
ncbi:MAG: M12 family metallopeptidase [Acidobacteria bacterium]|nr:M12 family metallopeptidase [Acidobacteriota bacterium]